MKEQHLLVDYENVQPSIEDLLKLAPKLTDVWLFHGPNQIKRAEQLKAAHERVVLVPHSGKGKNALDFHLSFYLGYVAAKHPAASLMVVANDKGYDSMIEHAKLLGFTASRSGFKAKKAPAAKEAVAPAKKVAAGKTTKPAAKKAAAPVAASPAPVKKQAASPTKKVKTAPAPQKKAPKAAQTVHPPAVKKAAVKSVTAPAKKAPAKKVTAKKAVTKAASTQQAPAAKAVASPPDKVLARAKASLAKMGKNRPTKLASLLRHLKSIVGQGASEADADALSRRLEAANVIQVVGDLVLYP